MEKNKCRICLNRRKRLRSLHDTLEKVTGITYAVIVASISNVKVLKNDKMSNEICLTCCRRITDIYEFKCQIERSDMELQKTCQIKRIIFADIQDIKCKIEINENDSKYEKPLQSYLTEKFVQSTKKSLNYNSTIINRLKIKTPDSALEKSIPVTKNLDSFKEDPDNENELKIKTLDSALKKSFLVTEYLDSIKEDPDSENDNADDGNVDYDSESESSVEEQNDEIEDEDYEPIKKYCYKKKAKSKKLLTNTDSYDAKKQMMCIKPVYIKDRVDYYNTRRTSETTRRKQSLYVCPICGVMVKFPKSHMLTHLNRERCAKCDQCSKSFYTKYSLIKHLKIHGKRDYQCDKCVATFYCKSLLKQHIKFHEGSVPRFPCEICSKTFRSKNHLWRHCQGVHNMGTKRFACDQCPMTFITKVNLNHHIRIHTRERPYKCEICSQPYSYKRDFDRHCLKKHGVSLKGRKVNIMNEEFMAKEKL